MKRRSMQWPDGNVLAVCPIVAWETWPDDLGTRESNQMTNRPPLPPNAVYKRDMWVVHDHEYAEEEGIWRLLDLFERVGLKATFVTSGRSVERFPDIAVEVRRRGHEMASENYIHEYPVMYDEAAERESIQKTVTAFERVLGQRPLGYISPGHRPTDNTLGIIADAGYIWDADFQDRDTASVMNVNGKLVVGMTYANISDYMTYQMTGRNPRDVLRLLIDEFDVLYAEGVAGAAKMMGYAFHPFLCHGFRTKPLEEFFRYAQSFPRVWFPTRIEIANWCLDQYKADPSTGMARET
ncbi:MAG: polysaccharide deacetylase family protein [Candidatus Binatia bacterium]